MRLGKLQKTLNKWQFSFFLGKDVDRRGFWRWEIWWFSLNMMPIEGGPLKKYLKNGLQMYKGFIKGNSYRIPEVIMRKYRWIPFYIPIKIFFR